MEARQASTPPLGAAEGRKAAQQAPPQAAAPGPSSGAASAGGGDGVKRELFATASKQAPGRLAAEIGGLCLAEVPASGASAQAGAEAGPSLPAAADFPAPVASLSLTDEAVQISAPESPAEAAASFEAHSARREAALPDLVGLIASHEAAETYRAVAAGILGAVCDRSDPAMCRAAIAAGAAPPLASMLAECGEEGQKWACTPFYNLVKAASSEMLAALSANNSAGLRDIARMLRRGPGIAQRSGAVFCFELLMQQPGAGAALAEAGIVAPLVGALDSTNDDASANARGAVVELISNIDESEDPNQTAGDLRMLRDLEAAGAAPALVRYVCRPNLHPIERAHALGGLSNLMESSEPSVEAAAAEVVATGAVRQLAAMLTSTDEPALPDSAAEAFYHLSASANDALHGAIALDALPQLVAALEADSDNVQGSACIVLKHVAVSSPERGEAVLALGVAPRLLQLVLARGPVAMAALEALVALHSD